MDVAYDIDDWVVEHRQPIRKAGFSHPDWYVLRARMRAARQAWQVLRATRGMVRRYGSFDRGSAWQLVALKSQFIYVNQTASANRNCGQDSNTAVAGISSTGERGLK